MTSGTFWRVVFAKDAARILNGSLSDEGRYHHDRQPALYMSPTPQDARIAVDAYLRPGDPPRVIVPLQVSDATLIDIRDAATCRRLGLAGHEANVPWAPERADGRPATSWIASDAVRQTTADGMIYGARSDATRWHVVLFRWNEPRGAKIAVAGAPIAFKV
jgi:RES domain-containing protein